MTIEKILKLLLALGLIALLSWVVWESRTIFFYFIIASVVALIGRPVYHFLEGRSFKQKKIPGALVAMLTLLILASVVTAVVGIFFPLILREAQVLYNIDFAQVRESLSPLITRINERMAAVGMSDQSMLSQSAAFEYLFNSIDFSSIPSILNNVLGVFGNVIIAVFSVAFMTFFILRDEHMLSRLILAMTPGSREESALRIIHNTRRTLSRYFLGLLLQVTAITLCVWIGLSIIGVKNALLIGFFTGLANLIPYLGPWIGATFGVIIMVSNNLDMGFYEVIVPKFYALLAVFAVTQLLDNYIFQPVIFSNSINAHPLEIFIIILIAGTLGGVLAMVAAIPVYAFIRIVVIELNKEFGILKQLKNN